MPVPTDTIADRLLEDVLGGRVDHPVSDLLANASGGDPVLLRTLVLTALGLGELICHEGRWQWNTTDSGAVRLAAVIENRLTVFSDAQLVALRGLTQAWIRPYELIAAELAQRSLVDQRSSVDQSGPDRRTVALTQRQRQVLALLGDGLTVEAIARRLCLSPRTVGKHLERMYRRLGTSDRLTTVLRARRTGLLADGNR